MDTTTDGPVSARSRSEHRPDPAAVWAPLAGLADAAADAASTGAVAISRGFDRNSRLRSKALRDLLAERGVSAIEVTSAVGSERLLAGSEVAAVVNLVGDGSWQPHRLAAKLHAPLFVVGESAATLAGESERDVIGVTTDEEVRDVALSRIAVLPEEPDAKLEVTHEDETLVIVGGRVEVTLHDGNLEVHLQGVDIEEQTFAAERIGISTAGAPHRFIRDELPIAEFEGALTVVAEPKGLVVRSA